MGILQTTLLIIAIGLAPVATAEEPGAASAPPPAAPAPAVSPDDDEALTAELAEARREVIAAQRELREANAALARASHGRTGPAELERLADRRQRAQRAFETARSRVPELIAQAHAEGISAAALRAYEHSLQTH